MLYVRENGSIGTRGRQPVCRDGRGMTLIECLLALFILSQVMLAFLYTANAGHDQLQYSRQSMAALRLADNLMEEILSRSYSGSGLTRAAFCIDDYDGFEEGPEDLHDCMGQLYADGLQIYGQRASVITQNWSIPELDNTVVSGKLITVTVYDQNGNEWGLSRCVMEPI